MGLEHEINLLGSDYRSSTFMVPEGMRLSWLLAASVTAAVILACATEPGHELAPKKRAPLDVPLSWQAARTSPGHTSHVTQRRLACDQCHAPESGQFENPGPAPCATCHEKESRITHATAQARAELGSGVQTDCTACHAFTGPAVDASSPLPAWDCARCHQEHVNQHPGAIGARAAHRDAPCQACHTPHGDAVAAPRDCASCHESVHLTHGRVERARRSEPALVPEKPSGALEAQCQVCHQGMHEPAAVSLGSCAECHAQASPVVTERALFAGGHERCVDCHKPHDFSPEGVVSCQSCHAQHAALAAAKVPAHADCKSCHRPHDARAGASQACSTCHQQLTTDHPAAPGLSACTSCHAPHPPAAQRGAAGGAKAVSGVTECSSCHSAAGHESGFHAEDVTCLDCHRPHHFKLADTGVGACQKCHAEEIQSTAALGAGHTACKQCHSGLPHDTSIEPAACGTCHAAQDSVAHKGHQRCQGCHEPHSGAVQKTCATCHAGQSATAPPGHRACAQCHEAHSGRLAVPSCTTCHASKSSAPHHDVKGGCQACHSAHGPEAKSPPACNTCHERASFRQDLHAAKEHARCQDCHQGHDKQPRPEPETCRSCHRDREQHFPETQRCSGCHLFKPL